MQHNSHGPRDAQPADEQATAEQAEELAHAEQQDQGAANAPRKYQATMVSPRMRCIACARKLSKEDVARPHPLLQVLHCKTCADYYGDYSTWSNNQDGTHEDYFCHVCGNGGDLFMCECNKATCYRCAQYYTNRMAADIESDEQWKCFVCDPKILQPYRDELQRFTKQHAEQQLQPQGDNAAAAAPEAAAAAVVAPEAIGQAADKAQSARTRTRAGQRNQRH